MKKLIYCDCKHCDTCIYQTMGDLYNPPECKIDYIIGEEEIEEDNENA